MYNETIIIGAGPAGIQLGCFLQEGGYDYVILEKSNRAGSFFHSYPHSGKLISVNKKYTGYSNPEFNLRHDWNSLLSEKGPLFTTYSNDYYPHRDELERYLNDFSLVNQINIHYHTTVLRVQKKEDGYLIQVSIGDQIQYRTCTKLIMATGLVPHIPSEIKNVSKRPILHYGQYPRNYFIDQAESFTNQSLCIIGDGNSSMELATHLTPYCSSIVVCARTSKNHEWAISTNYTGDVRGVYLSFFDTFMLKSLNGKTFLPPCDQYHIDTNQEGQFQIVYGDDFYKNYLTFDHIIYATGWKCNTDVFDFQIEMKGKLPHITPEYESVSHSNLFFIGSLGHSLDFKKSSGGFIHGFRYTIRYFYQFHYQECFPIQTIPLTSNWIEPFVDQLFVHLNQSSAMYQMHGQIGTIFFVSQEKIHVIHDVSIQLYHYSVHKNSPFNVISPTDFIFIMTLEFGKDKNNLINKVGSRHGYDQLSQLIHPVLRVYQQNRLVKETHFDEDLLAKFIKYSIYHQKLIHLLHDFF